MTIDTNQNLNLNIVENNYLNTNSLAFNFQSTLNGSYRFDSRTDSLPSAFSNTPKHSTHSITLQEAMNIMMNEHIALGTWSDVSTHKYRSQLQQIITFLDAQRLVRSLDKTDVMNVKAALTIKSKHGTALIMPTAHDVPCTRISGETIERYFNLLKRYLTFCQNNGYLHTNIHSEVSLPKQTKNPRKYKTFSPPELSSIFSGRVYSCAPEEKRRWKAQSFCFWVPLICAFSGARPGEACQIYAGDVHKIDGIWVFHFTNQGPTQTLKNKFSDRHVPVHPKLIEFGFLDFVAERLKEDGRDGPLFPDLPFDKRHGHARIPSRWFSGHGAKKHGYLGMCGLRKGDGYCLYSFRHTFINTLRLSGVQEMMIKKTVGHSTTDITFWYGETFTLHQIAEAIGKIRFDVDFTHVSWSAYQCLQQRKPTYQTLDIKTENATH